MDQGDGAGALRSELEHVVGRGSYFCATKCQSSASYPLMAVRSGLVESHMSDAERENGIFDTQADIAAQSGAPVRPSFEEWYAIRFRELVQLARLMVGSQEIALDIVQETLVGVLRQWERIDQPDHYARRAVTNACRSHFRRVATRRRHPVVPAEPAELGANEIDDALARLTPRQRAVLVLRYWSDLPESEIADLLGIRRGSVASLHHRALADLRKAIDQ